jgi:phosphatidylglycerol:prolipoprotein diacylglycerol transferase
MDPQLFGSLTYLFLWLGAALAGVAVFMHDARRLRLPAWQCFVAAWAMVLTVVLGSKLLFLLEYLIFPADTVSPWEQGASGQLLRYGFRIPGGILLMSATLPLVCRRLRLPTWRFADAACPAIGIGLVFDRTACLLNGCCYGRVSNVPWALSFPPASKVYDWQVRQHLITAGAARSLPVHPLQLYFLTAGLALFVLSRYWLKTKQFDGEVWIKSYLLFFGTTFFLELMRPHPLRLNVLLCAAVVLVCAPLSVRSRRAIAAAATVSH